MYYAGDPRHVPEVRIDINDESVRRNAYFFAHKKCYRKYFLRKTFLFAEESPYHLKVRESKPGDP